MITVTPKTIATIDGVDYPVIHQFPVLIKGWELDSDGYIILFNGKHRFLWSDHGDYYLVPDTTYEAGNNSQIDILKGFLDDYRLAIEKTQHAINLITGVNT